MSREFFENIMKEINGIIVASKNQAFSRFQRPCFHGENLSVDYRKIAKISHQQGFEEQRTLAVTRFIFAIACGV